MPEMVQNESDTKADLVRSRDKNKSLKKAKSRDDLKKRMERASAKAEKLQRKLEKLEASEGKEMIKPESGDNLAETSESTMPSTGDDGASTNSGESFTEENGKELDRSPDMPKAVVTESQDAGVTGDLESPEDDGKDKDSRRRSTSQPKKKKSDAEKPSQRKAKPDELGKSSHRKSKSSDMDKSSHKGSKGKSNELSKSQHKGKSKTDMDKSSHKKSNSLDKSAHKKKKAEQKLSNSMDLSSSNMLMEENEYAWGDDNSESQREGMNDPGPKGSKSKSGELSKSQHKGKSKTDMDKSSHKKSNSLDKSGHKKKKAEKKKSNSMDLSSSSIFMEENEYSWGDDNNSESQEDDVNDTASAGKRRGKRSDIKKPNEEMTKKKGKRASQIQDKAATVPIEVSSDNEKKNKMSTESTDSNDAPLELFAPISAGTVPPVEVPLKGEDDSSIEEVEDRRGPRGHFLTRQASKDLGRILKRQASEDDIFAALEAEAEEMEKESGASSLDATGKNAGKSSDLDKSGHKSKKKSSDMDKSSHRGKKGKSASMDKSGHKGSRKGDLDKSKHNGRNAAECEQKEGSEERKPRRVVRAKDMVREDSDSDSDTDSEDNNRTKQVPGKKTKIPTRSKSLPVPKWQPGQQMKPMAAAELREMLNIKGPAAKSQTWRDSPAFRDDFKPSVPGVFLAYPLPANLPSTTAKKGDVGSEATKEENGSKRSTLNKVDMNDALSEYLKESLAL